jgi:hypothetical protein
VSGQQAQPATTAPEPAGLDALAAWLEGARDREVIEVLVEDLLVVVAELGSLRRLRDACPTPAALRTLAAQLRRYNTVRGIPTPGAPPDALDALADALEQEEVGG